MNEFPENDNDFEEDVIDRVKKSGKGWVVTFCSGFSLWSPEETPEPRPGMTARKYGRGIGYPVRGLFFDGSRVFYRTEIEDQEKHEREIYGSNAKEMLDKWDANDIINTISMGGIGPGCEQAIQVAAMEVLRDLLSTCLPIDAESFTRESIDNVCFGARERCRPLGLSGAQWYAALHLAARFYRDGPAKTVKSAPADRRIMVSRHYPSITN